METTPFPQEAVSFLYRFALCGISPKPQDPAGVSPFPRHLTIGRLNLQIEIQLQCRSLMVSSHYVWRGSVPGAHYCSIVGLGETPKAQREAFEEAHRPRGKRVVFHAHGILI